MPAFALSLALSVGGCAASNNGPAYVAGPVTFPGDLPPLPPAPTQTVKVELEADGLPAQLAPRNRRAVADDPTEPWSPNYGSSRPSAPVAEPSKPRISAEPAKAPTRLLATATPAIDADDIIRRAIAEHEMRHR